MQHSPGITVKLLVLFVISLNLSSYPLYVLYFFHFGFRQGDIRYNYT